MACPHLLVSRYDRTSGGRVSEDKGAAKELIELATELQEGAGVLEALTRGTATLSSDDRGDLVPATTYAAALSEWGALHVGPRLTSSTSSYSISSTSSTYSTYSNSTHSTYSTYSTYSIPTPLTLLVYSTF